MRGLLSGITGEKSILGPIYNYEDYKNVIDLNNVFTFTPKDFLESLFYVKKHQVSGTIKVSSQIYLGDSHYDLGQDLGILEFSHEITDVFYDKQGNKHKIPVRYPMTFDEKPPQLSYPFNWYSKNLNLLDPEGAMSFYIEKHISTDRSKIILQNHSDIELKIPTMYWDPYDQDIGNYSNEDLTNKQPYRFSSSLNCGWDGMFSTYYNYNFFDKQNNLYYVLPFFQCNLLADFPPTDSLAKYTAINTITTCINPQNYPFLTPPENYNYTNYRKVGFLKYGLWTDPDITYKIPLYSFDIPGYRQFDNLDFDITIQAIETWQASDF